MGIQKHTEFEGTVDNLIYYNWLGIYSVRSMPTHVRQNEATKNAAKDFGLVSSRSKIIRDHLRPYLTDPKSKNMQMGLIKVLREILVIQKKVEADPPDHQPLKGFSFNESLKLDQCLQFPLIVSQTINSEITITIPQINPIQSISTPAGTSRVTIQALAIAFSFEHKNSFCEVAEPVTIAYTENMFPATVITLETPEKSPGMVLVVLSLTYWNKGRKITDNGYTPLQVIEVFNG